MNVKCISTSPITEFVNMSNAYIQIIWGEIRQATVILTNLTFLFKLSLQARATVSLGIVTVTAYAEFFGLGFHENKAANWLNVIT